MGSPVTIFRLSEEDMLQDTEKNDEELPCETVGEDLGNLTPQAEDYIIQLQSRLDAMKKVVAVSFLISLQPLVISSHCRYGLLFYICSNQIAPAVWNIMVYWYSKDHKEASPFSLLCPVEILFNIGSVLILSRFTKPHYNCQPITRPCFLQKQIQRSTHLLHDISQN